MNPSRKLSSIKSLSQPQTLPQPSAHTNSSIRQSDMILTAALASAILATGASAHGGVLSYSLAGTIYQGFVPYNTPTGQSTIQRQWATYDPITDATCTSRELTRVHSA